MESKFRRSNMYSLITDVIIIIIIIIFIFLIWSDRSEMGGRMNE